MKILLDENLPFKVNYDFGEDCKVFSVRDMNWSGIKNGELLEKATKSGFDVMITLDKNLKNQQNLPKFDIIFILLRAADNKPATIQTLVPKIKEVLSKSISNNYIEIN